MLPGCVVRPPLARMVATSPPQVMTGTSIGPPVLTAPFLAVSSRVIGSEARYSTLVAVVGLMSFGAATAGAGAAVAAGGLSCGPGFACPALGAPPAAVGDGGGAAGFGAAPPPGAALGLAAG